MAKTAAPGLIHTLHAGTFVTDAVPDPFDERDLIYQPRLQPLAPQLDQRDLHGCYVMLQEGSSCTGHAVATVINTVLAQSGPGDATRRVSPYMLYHLARRYDDFEGEDDLGSSLRGALKGWFHHGIALENKWPKLDTECDLLDPVFQRHCAERPLGAFYRVNAYRLDDMQSAINELHAIAVSAQVHDGWLAPVPVQRDGETMFVITRRAGARALGGHAFALVGYNEVGFLVQNSWGTRWGHRGFATLPYEEWLDSAYDAWVVRPGVPQTPFAGGRTRTTVATGGALAAGPGPDLRRLERHVVNLGNEGQLSRNGKFVSTPGQIDRIFKSMEAWHSAWESSGKPRRVVLFAHGGLVSEAAGLDIAQKHLDWWLNNHVYPISFAWQSGPVETLLDQLSDQVRGKLPFGGLGFDLVEQFDRLVENLARGNLRWMWNEMKENATRASAPLPRSAGEKWPPVDKYSDVAAFPGASLAVLRLRSYLTQYPRTEVHLVGHSAGSIFHAGLLKRLVVSKIKVKSLSLLAPAIRVDEFAKQVLPFLGDKVERFATFAMNDERELNDVCGAVYRKSLLYLVSRAFEATDALAPRGEVRLLGMEKYFDLPLEKANPRTLREAIVAAGGACVFAPSSAPANARCDAKAHGDLDDDEPTMTSVVMQIVGASEAAEVEPYTPHAARRPAPGIFELPAAGVRPEEATTAVAGAVSPVLEMLERQGWRVGGGK